MATGGRHESDLIDALVAYRAALIDLAARIVRCRCRAEDIVQDTVLKVLEADAQEQVRSPASYLFQMVRNRAIDLVRRAEFESCHFMTDEAALLEQDDGITPESALACGQTLTQVADALDRLPQRTRLVFQMHRMEGYTQKEIAARLQVSPTLVNFMVHDARSCLAALVR